MTNTERAKRCDQALRRYNDEWDVRSNLIDFLADARHWCDRHGECFADLDRLAYDHYVAEATSAGHGRMTHASNQSLRDAAPELLLALDYLLEQTVDADLKYGIELSEGEADARAKALAIIAKARR